MASGVAADVAELDAADHGVELLTIGPIAPRLFILLAVDFAYAAGLSSEAPRRRRFRVSAWRFHGLLVHCMFLIVDIF